jgi:hypothetical protein
VPDDPARPSRAACLPWAARSPPLFRASVNVQNAKREEEGAGGAAGGNDEL